MRAKASGAQTWSRKRRIVMKAEVVRHPGRAPKNNPRFVVTNLTQAPQAVYELYGQRGDMENRLKELHHGLAMDCTSCSRFLANPFRVLLTLAAYILFQDLRRRAPGTGCANAQVTTLREQLIKARGVGRTVGAPDRVASARGVPLAPSVAADRARRGRHVLNPSANSARRLPAGVVSLAGRLRRLRLHTPGALAPDVRRMHAPMPCLPSRKASPWPSAPLGVILVGRQ